MKTFSQHLGKILSPLFVQKLSKTGISVKLPLDKTDVPADKTTLNVTDWSFFTDVLLGYDLGFAESYLKGKWNTIDLTTLFTHFNTANGKTRASKIGNLAPLKLWGRLIQSMRSSNNLYWASKNIKDHYDFSNEFFSSFLDSSMTYSSGLFDNESDDLKDAQ